MPEHGAFVNRDRRPLRAILGLRNPKTPTIELLAVELLDSLNDTCLVREFDEGKSPRTTGAPIRGQEDFDNLTDLGKEVFELAPRSIVTQVSDKHS